MKLLRASFHGVLLFLCAAACGAAANAAEPDQSNARPIATPYGMLRFEGPPDMTQAPRMRSMPSPVELMRFLEHDPDAVAVVRLTVTTRGKLRDVHVISTNRETFAELCRQFAAGMKFRAARRGDRSVACVVEIPFGKQ